jgi:hypothetical protein
MGNFMKLTIFGIVVGRTEKSPETPITLWQDTRGNFFARWKALNIIRLNSHEQTTHEPLTFRVSRGGFLTNRVISINPIKPTCQTRGKSRFR